MMICANYNSHPDATVICPYDKEHKICRSRFQRHLVKCEKRFPKGYLEICPFDATHRLSKDEMKEHILSCPTKRFLEPALYQNTKRTKDYISNRLNYTTTTTIDLVESWSDDELQSPSEIIVRNTGSTETEVKTTDEQDSEDKDDFFEPLRRPYGYSELMMMETDNIVEDDMISVSSAMAMGRGRGRGRGRGTVSKSVDKHLFKRIGMGRGKGNILSEDL